MTKKALLIGLNEYSDGKNSLRGCVNDVEQVKGLLKTYYGFSDDAIKLLVNSQATKAGIQAGLDWLTTGSQAGDVLIFHYSGHGSQVADNGNDELDGADEIIIPYDHDWNNPLRDDDLKAAFDRIGPGVSLTVMMDCCHSGTGNRPVPPADADTTRLPISRYLAPPDVVTAAIKFLANLRNLFRPRTNRFQVVKTAENNVLVAACRDDQTSADAYIANDFHGAFTWYLAEAIQATGGHLLSLIHISEPTRPY